MSGTVLTVEGSFRFRVTETMAYILTYLLSIERQLTDEIVFDDVIEEFTNKKQEKL